MSKFKSKLYLALGVFANLAPLIFFKYTNFFYQLLNDLGLKLGGDVFIESIVLPLGISFFTFQGISYLVDAYRKRIDPQSLFYVTLFVSFFPQLVAGPIVRSTQLIPQLRKGPTMTAAGFKAGAFLFTMGAVKKIVVADILATIINNTISSNIHALPLALIAVYIFLFYLQIYCDFSGYTDMAIGLGIIFGYRFPTNFNFPLFATNVSDFWKRWHITLGSWLKDYLYIPLGGSKHGWWRTGLALMITMVLGGLWHGAGLNFVLWGFYQGIVLVIHKVWESFASLKFKGWVFISWVITQIVVTFGWFLFRLEWHQLEEIYNWLGRPTISVWHALLDVIEFYALEFFIAFMFLSVHTILFFRPSFIQTIQKTDVRWIIFMAIMITLILIFSTSAPAPFIYFRF